ncbi:type ISP restriction/modification enzyme [Streptomyces sp. NBC_00878]|uniref:type ISP restriction/modification enzyme n=1 Tax=Streptomyces sp. NBC_00878 TaxID=2975854 RepID=UPI0022566AAE|nr:type ISP restriction/modification enzyme [Streptomyces sp. NBC_00878]MCX4909986.1 DNA methyltransferase [Streptomyces sp. NBC_00878]
MPSVPHDDAPLLADLMPWSVAPPRLGRGWPTAPDAASLKARWDAFVKAEGADREALFGVTRARTLHSAVGQLPGQSSGTGRLARASGPCAEPVRVLHGPFDEQWLIPDHRLIDAARPELWRVADGEQVFAIEQAPAPDGPPLLVASALPVVTPQSKSVPAARPGRIRPLYRRPDGREPNLAPGLLDLLAKRLGHSPTPLDVLAWTVAVARPGPGGCTVPLTADPELWARGTELGHRMLWLMRRAGERPKLPGGRRPYVRAPLPSHPLELRYDRDEETLHLDEGRISPVPPAAWDFEVGGVRVLDQWFTARTTPPEPGTLEAIRPTTWPQPWTSDLLEVITVLSLLAELRPQQAELTIQTPITTNDLRTAGVLPVPPPSRQPASVLDHHEEGPEGQVALI